MKSLVTYRKINWQNTMKKGKGMVEIRLIKSIESTDGNPSNSCYKDRSRHRKFGSMIEEFLNKIREKRGDTNAEIGGY